MILGSNVRTKSGKNLSGIHHRGTARIPKRELWPDWDRWPEPWRRQIDEAMQDGVGDLVMRWLRIGGR